MPMADAAPERHYAPDPSLLERWAARFMRKHNTRQDLPERPRQASEIEALRRIRRRAVGWAMLAGIMSGGIIGGMEWFMRQGMLDGMQDMTLMEQMPYWIGFFAVAGVVSAVEILFLYWNALRGVASISRIADAPLHGGSHSGLILRGLSRVALEFPSPRHRIYGIDPYAYMAGWKLTLMAVMYRMKVGVSSFVLRVLVRRVLGRVALRGLLPLITGPLYALWNAIITWRIVNKAWEQALGPYAIDAWMDHLQTRRHPLGANARHALLHAVGEMLMRNQDAHPNHVYLLSRLMPLAGEAERHLEVDWPRHRLTLARLPAVEQRLVLDTLLLAVVVSGKPGGARMTFLVEAHMACAKPYPIQRVRAWRERFMKGQSLVVQAAGTP